MTTKIVHHGVTFLTYFYMYLGATNTVVKERSDLKIDSALPVTSHLLPTTNVPGFKFIVGNNADAVLREVY